MRCGRRARRRNVGGQLALEDRPRIDGRAVLLAERGDVGDERPSEPGRERRREIARLVRVREKDAGWLLLRDECHKGEHVAVRGVTRQRRVIDDDHFVHRRRAELSGDAVNCRAEDGNLDGPAGVLRRRNGLPRRAIQRPVALLCYNQNHSVASSSTITMTR